ncbi:DUF1738 domain-containing protein (plasmid) [Nostoc sp. C052]|uniref:ArdC family protein n=1 Tax=Nostoc sp. C052 TaxID=2576902 RepID=UPI0015C2C2B4|nr:zincin-like metallopeptidase domain-containing protein [Nostoc sp. C052]QLE46385.1 DUF1738 domain-containing protein [Nostoc sp. C052]
MADDKYQIVTDRLLEIMAKGTLPWRKEWKPGSRTYRNLTTGTVYQSTNTLICMVDSLTFGYESPFFVTFKAAKAKGWSIKKGAKATNLLKFRPKTKEIEKEDGEKTTVSFPFFDWFQVFNTDSIIDSRAEVKIADLTAKYDLGMPSEKERYEKAEAIITAQKANVSYGHSKAAYAPSEDIILMPNLEQFTHVEAYYSTHLHELIHRTGHPSRLNRKMNTDKNSSEYAFEELIAELGAAYVCQEVGIKSSLENHASYLNHWLGHLKSNEKAIFTASGAATKAANYILENAGIIKEKALAAE